jgi:hypothetical protein
VRLEMDGCGTMYVGNILGIDGFSRRALIGVG